MEVDVEERRLIIEVIATLVHIKDSMAEFILKPAGVPREVYGSLLHKRDENTGRELSKRQIAPLIIDGIEKRADCSEILRSLLEIAADWDKFHLAENEFAARATVQKARHLLGQIEVSEAREAKIREMSMKAELDRLEREWTETAKEQCALLLMMLDELGTSNDTQRRGFLLQDLLVRLFDVHRIPVERSFTRNEGGEQIDGAFRLDGWYYLVECRWRAKLADIRELDGLSGQVGRSGRQTMGLFLSINGWSKNVPALLKQNTQKSIVLMDGYDLRCVLDGQVNLRDLLLAKITRLNLDCEPFLGASQYLTENR